MFRLVLGFSLRSFTILILLTSALSGSAQTTGSVQSAIRGYYTEAQARLGKQQYAQNCSKCHLENLKGAGYAPALVGDAFLQDYYSVADLFSKTSMSMPGDNVHGLSAEAYVNIIAYLLQANGLPAAKESLKGDVKAMKGMLLHEKGAPGAPSGSDSVGPGAADGYFTNEQAARGKAYFHGSCSMCHLVDPSGRGPNQQEIASGRGYFVGSRQSLSNFVNERFRERWNRAGSLFNKIRTTMPAYDAGGLSTKEYVDIVAYLLEANGLPSGREDLTESTMNNIDLSEWGFERLFNGRDLSRFKFVIGNNCTPRPAGCAQTEPGSTFVVQKDGTIFCSGKPQGYMYTEKRYLNFTLRLEYRYQPYEGLESDDEFYGNSGYLLFINEPFLVWPKMIEIQGMNTSVLSVILSDIKGKATVNDEARKRALKSVGQWNSIEIVSKDGQVNSYLNGALISTITEIDNQEPGHIAFQSEGGQIYWRNIRIKAE